MYCLDAGILREIAVDERLRVGARDAEPLRKSERGDAVADAVVDHLGLVALRLGDVRERQAEDLGGGGAVDVLAAGERLEQAGVLRERGEDAQLDLRVVGGEERVVALARDEGAADFAALRGADGDVLQVGVLRIEPARAGGELVKGGVDAAVGGRDGGGQRVDVGGEEFAGFAIFETSATMGWIGASAASVASSVEYWPVLVFLAFVIEGEFAEENFAELLGRADVEVGAGVRVDGGFEPGEVGAEFFADILQRDGVEADAFVFHGGEDGQKRRFDFVEDVFLARFLRASGRVWRGAGARGRRVPWFCAR